MAVTQIGHLFCFSFVFKVQMNQWSPRSVKAAAIKGTGVPFINHCEQHHKTTGNYNQNL